MQKKLSVVGKRLPRPDAPDKATGAAKFTGDIQLPGMLFAKVLRCPHPHARIAKIDIMQAMALPGVEAVITFNNVPAEPTNMYVSSGEMSPPKARASLRKDQHILTNKARFAGDAIAAVAAIDRDTAEEAIELIRVEYELLPAVFDPLEAIKPDAPQVHEIAEGNIAAKIADAFPTGDIEKGFLDSDCIVEETFVTTKQKHCQLEPTACVARFDAGGRLTVWSPCELAHPARRRVALLFNIPEGNIRWLTPVVGGAFGAKLSLTNEPICIALAMKTGKPVKLEDTREEDFIAHESRQPFIIKAKMGLKEDGTMTALQFKAIADAGAYFSHSGSTTRVGMSRFLRHYRCPNTSGEIDVVYTNTPVTGGFRGYGCAGTMFALEQLVDITAGKLGINPLELRLKNIKHSGEPDTFPSIPIENSALEKCIRIGARRIGWQKKWRAAKAGRFRRGVGMACTGNVSNAYPAVLEHSNAFIKMNPDGSANLIVSPCEMGQGILVALSQIAAEVLGLGNEDIHVVTGDTDVTMFDIGSHASRSTYVIGNAVLRAAQEVKEQLLERASAVLGADPEQLEVRDKRVFIKSTPERGVSISDICRDAIYNFEGKSLDFSGRCSFTPQASPSFLACFAEVEVDTETGQVKVLKMEIVDDLGCAINPMTVEGQLEGGAAQGIGFALIEDFVVDMSTGTTITDSFSTYKIPTALDLPDIGLTLVEEPVSSGPFGAKGVGEIGVSAIAPAIANAICNAVGVRIMELPITPEKILKALHAK